LEEYNDVHVILGSRDVQRGKEAVSHLKLAVPKGSSRVEMLQLDVSNQQSVRTAAQSLQRNGAIKLYGIVNNAGRGVGISLEDTLATNYWGARYVCDAFMPMFHHDSNTNPPRVVNVGSAAGPLFVNELPNSTLKENFSSPWTIPSIQALDDIASSHKPSVEKNSWAGYYGFSKALLAAYTYLLAREYPNNIINAVTPGFIATDMSQGYGATNPPSTGAVPIVHCLMSESLVGIPQGRYYGSDMIRSPLNKYRGPGEPAYEGPDGP
jgi:carbonyl reductase 1